LRDELPVSDIDIQEVPIEEVIRRVFAGQHAGASQCSGPLKT